MNKDKKPKFDLQTDNANYFFSADSHNKSSRGTAIAASFDAIVLETGAKPYEEWGIPALLEDEQYRELIRNNMRLEKPKPVFYVDMPDSEAIRKHGNGASVSVYAAEQGLSVVAPFIFALVSMRPEVLPLMTPFAYLAASPIAITNKKYAKRVLGYTGLLLFFSPMVGGRSSLMAEKIDSVIAPELKERLGRKPDIYLSFGAAHVDLLSYLRHERLRKGVIRLHRALNFIPFDSLYANLVGEISFGEGSANLGEAVSEMGGSIEGKEYAQRVLKIAARTGSARQRVR